MGVYLVAATALWAAELLASELLLRVIGPQPDDVFFAMDPFLELLLGAVFVTGSIALYATAFDRAVAAVTDTPWRPGRTSTASPAQRVSRTRPAL